MAECKGLVKLFGKTILVPPDEEDACCSEQVDQGDAQEDCNHSLVTAATRGDDEPPESEETNDQATASSTASNDQKPSTTPTAEQEAAVTTKPSNIEPNENADNSQSKPPLKKPDKILPCPRCSSLDTKFCYFNNYNVNQPRHFCKNCQRYWTDGGSMRNVPVGAGRRRSKNSAVSMQLNKHIAVSGNGLQTVAGPLHDVQRPQCANGTMLCFNSEMVSGVADGSVASVLSERITTSTKKEEERNSHSARSAAVQSNPAGSVNGTVQNCSDTSVQVPLNGSSWGCNLSPVFPLYSNYYPSVFYPVGQSWGFAPWITPGLPPLSSPPSNISEAPASSLGKHSREESHPKDKNMNSANPNAKDNAHEKSLWMPKTLRITDPEEAAMSSIWLSIGIKKGKGDDAANGGMFKGFQSKVKPDAKIASLEMSQHMNPNPAALSRSHNFHERLC